MNIFRYEMDSDGEDAKQVKDSLVNIGQIIKSGSYPVDGSVIFTDYYWTKPIEEDMLVILSTDEKPQKLNSITVPSTTSNSTPIDYARTADYSSRN